MESKTYLLAVEIYQLATNVLGDSLNFLSNVLSLCTCLACWQSDNVPVFPDFHRWIFASPESIMHALVEYYVSEFRWREKLYWQMNWRVCYWECENKMNLASGKFRHASTHYHMYMHCATGNAHALLHIHCTRGKNNICIYIYIFLRCKNKQIDMCIRMDDVIRYLNDFFITIFWLVHFFSNVVPIAIRIKCRYVNKCLQN